MQLKSSKFEKISQLWQYYRPFILGAYLSVPEKLALISLCLFVPECLQTSTSSETHYHQCHIIMGEESRIRVQGSPNSISENYFPVVLRSQRLALLEHNFPDIENLSPKGNPRLIWLIWSNYIAGFKC